MNPTSDKCWEKKEVGCQFLSIFVTRVAESSRLQFPSVTWLVSCKDVGMDVGKDVGMDVGKVPNWLGNLTRLDVGQPAGEGRGGGGRMEKVEPATEVTWAMPYQALSAL